MIILRKILGSRGITYFNTTSVMFNQSRRTVDGTNLETLFRNCSHSSLSKIISKYRTDFLLCGYDRTLDTLYQLLTAKKTEEEKKTDNISY